VTSPMAPSGKTERSRMLAAACTSSWAIKDESLPSSSPARGPVRACVVRLGW
jgi:hypothetical protein